MLTIILRRIGLGHISCSCCKLTYFGFHLRINYDVQSQDWTNDIEFSEPMTIWGLSSHLDFVVKDLVWRRRNVARRHHRIGHNANRPVWKAFIDQKQRQLLSFHITSVETKIALAIEDVQIDLDHHFDPFRTIFTMEREQHALAINRVPPPVLTDLQRKKIQVDELIVFNAVVNNNKKQCCSQFDGGNSEYLWMF